MPTRIHVTTESLQPSAQRWDSVYTTFKATSSLFTSSSSIQTLEFDEITSGLMILGGNTVSLSSLANVGTGIDTEVRSLTSQWDSTYTTVQANSAVNWNYQGTDLKSLSGNWQETYTTFKNASSTFLTSETDSQTLAFDEVTKDLSISNGNTVSLSAFGTGSDVEVRALTAKWEETYTTFRDASSTFLTSETDSQTLAFDEITKNLSILSGNSVSLSALIDGTAIDVGVRALTADYASVYTTYNQNSATYATINFTDSKFLPLSGGTITGAMTLLSTLKIGSGAGPANLYINGSQIGINTETPNEELTVVGDVSATGVLYDQTGNSILWNEVFTSYALNSSTFLTSETDSQQLSFDEGTKQLSISNGNFVSLSALVDGAGIDVGVRALTGDYTSVYNTVQSNSAVNWNYQGTDLKQLSANWQNTFTTVTASSAKWETTYTSFNANSAIYVKTIATTTPGTSAITTIVAVSALPVSPDFNTLYIVI